MEVEESKQDKSMLSAPTDRHNTTTQKLRRRRRRRNICLAVIAVILLVVLIIVILGFTVFKAKRPVTTVNSVSIKDLNFSSGLASIRVNVTLDVDLSVKNPNKVGFKYTNSSAFLKYRGEVVGEVLIPAGKISADETSPMNLTLTLMADRLLSNSNLFSDAISGTLPLTTYTRISGSVRILFKFHVVTYTTCDLTIDIGSRRVANQTCHYRTKL